MARRLAIVNLTALVLLGTGLALLMVDVLSGSFLNEDFAFALLIFPIIVLGTAVATAASALALSLASARHEWGWFAAILLLQLVATGAMVVQLAAPGVWFQLLTVHAWRLDGGFFHVNVVPELVVPLLQPWASLVMWVYVRRSTFGAASSPAA